MIPLNGIAVGRIRTFPFFKIPFKTPSLMIQWKLDSQNLKQKRKNQPKRKLWGATEHTLCVHVTLQFFKSKMKEPPKVLPSSGIRRGKLISVFNFSVQKFASSGNQPIFNFRALAVRDIKLRTCLSKNIYQSRDFYCIQKLKYQEKCLCKCFFVQYG